MENSRLQDRRYHIYLWLIQPHHIARTRMEAILRMGNILCFDARAMGQRGTR